MTDPTTPNNSNPGATKESAANAELQSSLELKKCLYEICEPMCLQIVQNNLIYTYFHLYQNTYNNYLQIKQ